MKNSKTEIVASILLSTLPTIIINLIQLIFMKPKQNWVTGAILIFSILLIVYLIRLFRSKKVLLKIVTLIIGSVSFAFVYLVLKNYLLPMQVYENRDSIYLSFIIGASCSIAYLELFYPTVDRFKEWFEQNRIAMTATCFAFRDVDGSEDNVEIALYYNEKQKYWLPPGGHVRLNDNEIPEEIAKKRALDELGLVVEIIPKSEIESNDYEGCASYNSPFKLYRLAVNERAECRLRDNHEEHLDFAYSAKILEKKGKQGIDILYLSLSKNADKSEVETKLITAIKQHLKNNGDKIPDTLCPADLGERIFKAKSYYIKE
jgi:hypothetical protein